VARRFNVAVADPLAVVDGGSGELGGRSDGEADIDCPLGGHARQRRIGPSVTCGPACSSTIREMPQADTEAAVRRTGEAP
jgi:hypothetical protein